MTEHVEASVAVHRANQWMAEQLRHLQDDVRAQRLEHGTLVIACSHPAVAQEVMGVAQELLCALQHEDIRVKNVRCVPRRQQV